MNGIRKTALAAAIAGSMLVGGVGGAVLYAATTLTASAASPSPSPSSSSSSSTGTFVPNEDPTHEAGESAAREAQENAGQIQRGTRNSEVSHTVREHGLGLVDHRKPELWMNEILDLEQRKNIDFGAVECRRNR